MLFFCLEKSALGSFPFLLRFFLLFFSSFTLPVRCFPFSLHLIQQSLHRIIHRFSLTRVAAPGGVKFVQCFFVLPLFLKGFTLTEKLLVIALRRQKGWNKQEKKNGEVFHRFVRRVQQY